MTKVNLRKNSGYTFSNVDLERAEKVVAAGEWEIVSDIKKPIVEVAKEEEKVIVKEKKTDFKKGFKNSKKKK